jgi:tripartite-type tricarboxylate transporter receptor subunit TctC
VAPAGVARTIVTRLNIELADIVRTPELREKLLGQGAEPLTDTPEHFAAYIKSEIKKWASVVKLAGISEQ